MTTTRMTSSIILSARFEPIACPDCGFSSRDTALLNNHSCEVATSGGYCEDFPACGHEMGDCNGALYGSDAAIKAAAWDEMMNSSDWG